MSDLDVSKRSDTRYPSYRVSGDTDTRSIQYGSLARNEIIRTRNGYERAFATKGVTWPEAVEFALEFVPAIENYFPELLREIRGIAEGSRLPFGDILAMNCRTEILWHAAVTSAEGISPSLRGECSSFALEADRTAGGRVLVGQNWDWLEVLADGVIVLEVDRPDGLNYVTVVEAGLLAKTSMNSSGMAIGINTIVSSLDGGTRGVPFHVLVRAIVEAQHVSDVVEILSNVPRASSGNYIVASEDGAVLNVETGPGDVRTVHPLIATNGAVIHTNHFLQEPANGFDLAAICMPDSFVRYGRLHRSVVQREAPLSITQLQAVLADHADAPNSICCHPDIRSDRASRWSTLVSAIMDPAARALHLAEGPPCSAVWNEHDYSEFLDSWTELRDSVGVQTRLPAAEETCIPSAVPKGSDVRSAQYSREHSVLGPPENIDADTAVNQDHG